MKNRTLVLLILMFGLAMLSIHLAQKELPDEKKLAEESRNAPNPAAWLGRTAPDFEMSTTGGERFKLSEHIGKEVVIINFFATWCGPCRQEMPELTRFHGEIAGKPIVMVGVDAGETTDRVEDFVKAFGVEYPIIIDGAGELQKRYKVTAFPTTVLIGVNGKVQLYETGAINNTEVAFKKLIDANMDDLSAGRTVSAEEYTKAAALEKNAAFPAAAEPKEEKEDPKYVLDGRAKKIAETMTCPCGCSDKVLPCKCDTAKKIKLKLKTYDFRTKSDADVIKELNAEFCVKEEQS